MKVYLVLMFTTQSQIVMAAQVAAIHNRDLYALSQTAGMR
jgi:hypothetical protein